MTLRNKEYKERLLDTQLKRHLRAFGAVEIIGSMWCGKTWMADAHGESKINLSTSTNRDIVSADHSLAFEGARPHIIDEWQEVPELWDEARIRIDDAAGDRGLFILTGSSTPVKDEVVHSGTGRISRMRLRPMSLFETGVSDGIVSLSGLFEGKFKQASVSINLRDIAGVICRGGWPGSLSLDKDSASLVPLQYIDTFISSMAQKNKFNEYQFRRLLLSLARNIGQAVTYQTLVSDMVEGDAENRENPISRQQIDLLIDYAKDRFLIEDVSGWDAPIRSKSRVRTKTKRSFVDPSLAAALLGIDAERLLSDGQLFGKLFEELCLRDLRIYASCMDMALPNPVMYYRDSDNLEVDAIIELRDGRWAAIEIKLGENKVDDAIRNLIRLKNKIASNPMARNKEPSFMAVLVGKTDFCRKTSEGVYIVPVTSLTA